MPVPGQPGLFIHNYARGESIRFRARGKVVPQGSMRAYIVHGHPVLTSTAKGLKEWRRLVSDQAQRVAPSTPWDGPIGIHVTFWMPRPKSEPKTRRTWPDRRPDIDKLLRSTLDALTDVVFNDDGQVVEVGMRKDWGPPGIDVDVYRIEESKMAKELREGTT
jgi:crossover junction endodeoxyribonuclease RusA